MKRTALSVALLGAILWTPLVGATESGAAPAPTDGSRDVTAPVSEVTSAERGPATASQPTQPVEAARALFEKGRELAASAHYAEACTAFEESLALSVRVSTEFNLADCWERVGRLASAHELYRKIAAELDRTGESQRAEISWRRAAWLRDRLCGLSVELQERHEGVVVTLAGRELTASELDEAVPVDPGTQRLAVTAPDREDWTTELEVESCPGLVSVVVPPLRAREKPNTVVPVTSSPAAAPKVAKDKPVAAPAVASPPTAPMPQTEPNLLWPVAAGTIGVGALIVGIVSAAQYQSKNDAARAICPASFGCTTEEIVRHASLVEDARGQATWAYVGFGVGAAGLGGAVLLYLLERPVVDTTKDRRGRMGIAPVAAPNAWGAVVRGSF